MVDLNTLPSTTCRQQYYLLQQRGSFGTFTLKSWLNIALICVITPVPDKGVMQNRQKNIFEQKK
jgi:hypothetical protein